jgi:hypothetical protein
MCWFWPEEAVLGLFIEIESCAPEDPFTLLSKVRGYVQFERMPVAVLENVIEKLEAVESVNSMAIKAAICCFHCDIPCIQKMLFEAGQYVDKITLALISAEYFVSDKRRRKHFVCTEPYLDRLIALSQYDDANVSRAALESLRAIISYIPGASVIRWTSKFMGLLNEPRQVRFEDVLQLGCALRHALRKVGSDLEFSAVQMDQIWRMGFAMDWKDVSGWRKCISVLHLIKDELCVRSPVQGSVG